MNIRFFKIAPFLLALVFNSCATKKPVKKPTAKAVTTQPKNPAPSAPKEEVFKVILPEVDREFRAAWIATVANINWPSKNNLSTQQQKDEAIRILDMLKEANFNAVIFQARPAGDAMYNSSLEPWSYYLTGTLGKAPAPFYDPLAFWITEAHKRGMELHAWLNPYRAHHTTGGPVTSASIVKKMPQQISRLRNGMYWMDPSDEVTQNHAAEVIRDIVKRYDVDAIHIDDYFYPYREYNGGKDFPDDRTWNAYKKTGGNLSRADWRRANVNKFIKRIHDEIKQVNKEVRFGISPFGIWKPGYPAGIKGSSQFDELYADARLWLNEGWLDYFSPQLYWKSEGPQSFPALLQWWAGENKVNRHLWPGLNTVGLNGVSDRPAEIIKQINTTRALLKNNSGVIHYSVAGFTNSPAMYNAVKNAYSTPALVPATTWIKATAAPKPLLYAENNGSTVKISWSSKEPTKVFNWLLYKRYGDSWETEILPQEQLIENTVTSKNGKKLNAVAVKSVDRLGNESMYEAVKVK